jgi:hypothetical protein
VAQRVDLLSSPGVGGAVERLEFSSMIRYNRGLAVPVCTVVLQTPGLAVIGSEASGNAPTFFTRG